MTVVHNHPHPLAMTVVTPANPEIFKKFGKVRVEDWADRVLHGTWLELRDRTPEVQSYMGTAVQISSPLPGDDRVVACHTLNTGERVLLHEDWL